jgi:SnoaL-like protein
MDDGWVEKLAIQELCSRYCQPIDAQDSVGWARCFTPDGAFQFVGHVVRCAYSGLRSNMGVNLLPKPHLWGGVDAQAFPTRWGFALSAFN